VDGCTRHSQLYIEGPVGGERMRMLSSGKRDFLQRPFGHMSTPVHDDGRRHRTTSHERVEQYCNVPRLDNCSTLSPRFPSRALSRWGAVLGPWVLRFADSGPQLCDSCRTRKAAERSRVFCSPTRMLINVPVSALCSDRWPVRGAECLPMVLLHPAPRGE
jgi:hypothetical protein